MSSTVNAIPQDRDEGLAQARALLKIKDHDKATMLKKKVVGGFGSGGVVMYWVVSPRKDMRHGIVNSPAIKDPYQEELFDSMFRKWK